MRSDWESWGDVRLDLESASINTAGDEGWIAVTATVSQTIGREEYASYLTYVRQYIAESPGSAEEKLRYILRGASKTLYEVSRGERFVWPLRVSPPWSYERTGTGVLRRCPFRFPRHTLRTSASRSQPELRHEEMAR